MPLNHEQDINTAYNQWARASSFKGIRNFPPIDIA